MTVRIRSTCTVVCDIVFGECKAKPYCLKLDQNRSSLLRDAIVFGEFDLDSLFRQEVIDKRNDRLLGEIVITRPPSTRILIGALALVCVLVLVWLTTGTYARIESAPGLLVTDRPSPRLTAPLGGVVSALNVSEGTFVRAGQTVAVLTSDRQADVGPSAASVGVEAIDARLGLGSEQVGIGAKKRLSERARLASALSAAEGQAANLAGQISLQRDIVGSTKTLFDQIGPVMERGFVSKVEFERRRQAYLNAQQSLAGLVQQQLVQRAQAEQTRAQLSGLVTDGAREANEIQSSMKVLQQQRAELEGQKAYAIKAPTTGRVTAMQTNVGSSVLPGAPILTIIPEASSVRAEVYAPSRAIGFVRPGDEVRLLYDAFPYQRFGSAKGTVSTVSRIIIDPRDANIPVKLEEPVYKVTVTIERQTVTAFGQELALQPGMALRANIVLERQSFLDWLLTPLRAVANRS